VGSRRGRRLFLTLLLAPLLTAFAGCVPAQRVPLRDPPSLDLLRLLPAPPAPGSLETRAELDRILEVEAARTPEREALARADVELSLFRLLLGDDEGDLRPAGLPGIRALSDRLRDEVLRTVEPAKQSFARPRPFVLDPRIRPCVPTPSTPSYPSGHASFAMAGARVLIDLAPEWGEEITSRAREFAWSRVVCGVHYPSDVVAGEVLGRAIAERLLASPRFRRGLEPARRELRAALGLAPEPALQDRSA